MKMERIKRIVAMYLVLNLVFEIVSPSLALALTNGPAQPEMQSFEPVGTSEMVDVFTGDFNYNIPLLNVPGPNGGYPINLAYHSGIGMEDEASWTGLGWNINAGAITREMRGLPDDFDGDVVSKEMNMNPNRTIGTGIAFPLAQIEVWGFQFGFNANLRMSWNNYQGLGVSAGLDANGSLMNSGASDITRNNSFSPEANLSLDFNSSSGETSLTPNFSLAYNTQRSSTTFGLGASISNLQGLKQLNYSSSYHRGTFSGNSTVTYNTSNSFVPHSDFPQSGFMLNTYFKLGLDAAGLFAKLQFNADYTQTGISTKNINLNAYGYMHSEDRRISDDVDDEDYKLMDFNREKDVALSKDIPSMPIPVFTHDVYMVKGQGVGGVFRPYRSDVGILHDPAVKGENTGGTVGAEFGAGIPLHFGGNLGLSFTRNYTGPWRKYDTWKELADRQFTPGGKPNGGLVGDPLYEPFYFKTPSELTANLDDENDMVTENGKYPLAMVLDPPSVSDFLTFDLDELLRPFVEARVQNGGLVKKKRYDNRRSRSQFMDYKSIGEMNASQGYQNGWVGRNIYAQGTSPRNSSSIGYSFPGGIDHQIGELSVINPDGNRYIYALPAYNLENREVSFSVEKGSHQTYYNDKIVSYTPTDASLNNSQQKDHFYASNSVPKYAHSYMLTAIVSPDYVDLTGNGPSDDDFGYFVKFNYSKTNSAYQWRAPYEGANFLKGHLSSDMDDKAGYVYGQKEIWYLNSIETKTHMAEFKMSPRADGYGASSQHQQVNQAQYLASQQLYKLDKISLYAKSDPSYSTGTPIPMKEANFEYSYDLCPNVRNNNGQAVNVNGVNVNQNKGKLTLKKVWFTYLKNMRGSLSPYVFDYHEGNPQENPAYDILQMDRWGNYRKDNPATGDDNTVNPYTIQDQDLNGDGQVNDADTDLRNSQAAAWNLKRIVLPSGGELKIDFEPDDYAYVQDKKAMQMTKILGYANKPDNGVTLSNNLAEDNEFLFFDLENETGAMTADQVKNYAKDLDEVFFKVYLDLKSANGGMKTDYVQGYAEVEKGNCGLTTANVGGTMRSCGYLKIKKVAIKDKPEGAAPFTHPFRKAGWQYLKLERPEVLYPGSQIGNGGGAGMLMQAANIFVDMLNSASQLFSGYYKYCFTKGYAKTMNLEKPSFVRLHTPDNIKYGGGHRVKRIAVTDLWAETAAEGLSSYGQEYTYRMPDGTSSGVAAYEPMMGGEEIPHRKPIRYSSPFFIYKNSNLYIEEPLGESYFPAPVVGYSRVITKNLAPPAGVISTKTQDGVTIQEFYTAKDFPIILKTTDPDHEKHNPKIPIPFIGSVMFENHACSQRLGVETNDMHGKMKSISTYAGDANLSNPNTLPVSRSEYIYKTDAPYSPVQANHLNNRVNVLFKHGIIQESDMGVTHEFFTDMRESSGVTMKQGFQANVEYTPPFLVVFTGMPSIDYSESLYKTVVAMDVSSRNGILMQVNNYTDGSKITSQNILFDANTGQALETSVTNDFDKPVYTYNYAAHWAYDGMGNAFKNAGAMFDFDISADMLMFNYSGRSAFDVFVPGDEILVTNATPANYLPAGQPTTFWVKKVQDETTVQLVSENGNPPAGIYGGRKQYLRGKIMRSGRRNQQSVSNGSIVSLNDIAESNTSLLKRWNEVVDEFNTNPANIPTEYWFGYTDCNNQSHTIFAKVSFQSPNFVLIFSEYIGGGLNCTATITFPSAIFPGLSPQDVMTYKLYRVDNGIVARKNGTSTLISEAAVYGKCPFFTDRCDEILNATASEFSDAWTFDYADVGNPLIQYFNGSPQALASVNTALNPYRTGVKGIWRNQKSYAYQINRRQLSAGSDFKTNIAKDGIYEKFDFFNWTPNVGNPAWTLANTVTRYSPYGFELENKNALGINSAALYAYKNSLPSAVAANSAYTEMAFDAFEEQQSYAANGHIALTSGSGISVTNSEAHTGKKSLMMMPSQTLSMATNTAWYKFVFPAGATQKKYSVSAWFKTPAGTKPQIAVSGQINSAETRLIADGVRIEGWQKAELNFTATGPTVTLSFSVPGSTGISFFDDVRIQPFTSTMKTYVYDPQTLWLKAELDEQNYATFYNYDQEGTLVQTKKETVNGVQTVKASRSHLKQ